MAKRSDGTLAELVTDLLCEGPRTGYDLAKALEARYRLSIRGREGALYAALVQLERDGWIVRERGAGGRLLYSLPVLEAAVREGAE